MANELVKVIGGQEIRLREADRYFNASELSKASGKRWNDYWRNKDNQAVLEELAFKTGIPVINDSGSNELSIVQVSRGTEKGSGRGKAPTWIHPKVAIDFARWASPKFGTQIIDWVFELMTTGKVELAPQSVETPAKAPQMGNDMHHACRCRRRERVSLSETLFRCAERVNSVYTFGCKQCLREVRYPKEPLLHTRHVE